MSSRQGHYGNRLGVSQSLIRAHSADLFLDPTGVPSGPFLEGCPVESTGHTESSYVPREDMDGGCRGRGPLFRQDVDGRRQTRPDRVHRSSRKRVFVKVFSLVVLY